jgi:hypothetical protein
MAEPDVFAFANPLIVCILLTLMILLSLDFQTTNFVMSFVLPSEYFPIAENAFLEFDSSGTLSFWMVID